MRMDTRHYTHANIWMINGQWAADKWPWSLWSRLPLMVGHLWIDGARVSLSACYRQIRHLSSEGRGRSALSTQHLIGQSKFLKHESGRRQSTMKGEGTEVTGMAGDWTDGEHVPSRNRCQIRTSGSWRSTQHFHAKGESSHKKFRKFRKSTGCRRVPLQCLQWNETRGWRRGRHNTNSLSLSWLLATKGEREGQASHDHCQVSVRRAAISTGDIATAITVAKTTRWYFDDHRNRRKHSKMRIKWMLHQSRKRVSTPGQPKQWKDTRFKVFNHHYRQCRMVVLCCG